MVQVDETDLVYKGPWVRSAQQRLFQTLEDDYSFPEGYLPISGEPDVGFSQ